MAHENEPQAENDGAENGLLHRIRIVGQFKRCEKNLGDYSGSTFGTILNSYMVATLIVSGSQGICASLQTMLNISGIKQHPLKRFNAQVTGADNSDIIPSLPLVEPEMTEELFFAPFQRAS